MTRKQYRETQNIWRTRGRYINKREKVDNIDNKTIIEKFCDNVINQKCEGIPQGGMFMPLITGHNTTSADIQSEPKSQLNKQISEGISKNYNYEPQSKSIIHTAEGRKSLVKQCWIKHERRKTSEGGGSLQNSSITTLLIIYFIFLVQTVVAQDNRCFLQQGGSVENFFVKESLPVGSVIGTLGIGGNASENGDIYLRLQEVRAAVQISPNSKDLTLTGKLDKEGKDGPSHVVVNVVCNRRGTTDPSMTIPVNIRVTDDNDNAPVFQNAPYHVNVSEGTVVGTIIVGDIKATDDDQKGPYSTVQYSVAPGPYSDKFDFESPLSGSLRLRKPLDFETDPKFNITIVAQDQGAPVRSSTTFVTVTVQDSDDQNPQFFNQRYMAFVPDPPVRGSRLQVQPESIKAVDQDKGILANVLYSLERDVPEAKWFGIDPNTGEVYLDKDVQEDDFQQPVSLSITAIQSDNRDRRAGSILTVSRRGFYSTQLQFVIREYEATVLESLPVHSLITQTMINKAVDQNIKFSLERDGAGVFHITDSGQVLLDYQLDYEDIQQYQLKIFVTDGQYNDTANLIVKVLNVNDWDPRFRYPAYEFFVPSNNMNKDKIIGNVEVADGDRGDQISLSIMGQDANMFLINSNGSLKFKEITDLNSTEAHFVILAKDSGRPPRKASVPVVVRFPAALVKSAALDTSYNFLMMVVFGALLGLFVLVIICLAIYIHKNSKKYRDDNDGALPTKMNQIVSNGNPPTKLDSLSSLSNTSSVQQVGLGSPSNGHLPGVEANNNIDTTDNNHFGREPNQSNRASTISVKSIEEMGEASRTYLKNPLANGLVLGSPSTFNADKFSLNGTVRSHGSASTVTITGTPDSLRNTSRSSLDGIARASGGLPSNKISPAPPPPVPPPPPTPFSPPPPDVTAGAPHRKISNGGKVYWPPGSIPRKVKKLSWEDELNSQTELDPEVSVTPMPNNAGGESPNLTVYF